MSKSYQDKYGKWALVTGGSAGIGLAFSQQLAAKGMNLVLVARQQSRLEQAKQDIRQAYNVDVLTCCIDLQADNAIDDLKEATQDIDIGMVVLNAGMEVTGHFAKQPLATHNQLMQLNMQVPTQMAHIFSERFIRRGRGAMVFVASLFAYQAVPLFNSYCASKAYILTLGEGLSVELKPYGVDVLVVSPGPTDTAMLAGMDIDFSKMPIITHQPRKVAQVALKALGKKISVVPGLLNWVYAFENRFIPRDWPIRLFGLLTRRALDPKQSDKYLLKKTTP